MTRLSGVKKKSKQKPKTSIGGYLQEQATAENVSGVKPGQSRRLTPTIHSERASQRCLWSDPAGGERATSKPAAECESAAEEGIFNPLYFGHLECF